MEKLMRNKKTILMFAGPAVFLYMLVLFVPVVFSISMSFFSWDSLTPMKFVGFNNFIKMFTADSVFYTALINTVFFLVISVVGQQLLGLGASVALTSNIKMKNFFKNIYFLPSVLSTAAVGLLWGFIFNPRMGALNTMLTSLGLESLTRQWLVEMPTALFSIGLVVIWQYTGYTMTIFMAAIEGIPSSVYEAAYIDGASKFTVIRTITLPLIKPMIKINTLLIAVGSLKFFDLIYTMTNGGPDHQTEVLASHIYLRSFRMFEYGYGNALSLVLLVLCLIVSLIINKSISTEKFEY